MTPKEEAAAEAMSFIARLNAAVIFPIIYLMSGVAFLWFVYGCAIYIINAGNDQAREEGKKNITYGIIGLVIMVSAYAILSIATGTFGLNKQLDCATSYTAGCDDSFKLPN